MLGGGGVGHNIKRPKLACTGPATNISALPTVPVELPGRKPAAPARPAPSPATHGQITVSSKAKVQFEVKGGQFVYRAKAKTAITPRYIIWILLFLSSFEVFESAELFICYLC